MIILDVIHGFASVSGNDRSIPSVRVSSATRGPALNELPIPYCMQ